MTAIAPDTRATAQRLRNMATPQERALWAKLREVNRMIGTHFRRQAPIGRFIADFVDHGRRLVIEVDGGGHGGARDGARDAWLQVQGYRVLRFCNTDVADNMNGVMQTILDAIETAPPPQPSPTGGEGGAHLSTRAQGAILGASPPPRGEGKGVGGLPAERMHK